jgi:pyrroloquinoline quinone (PQQ) biosynthesis protein C
MEALLHTWEKSLGELLATPFFARLREGSLDIRHYRALLREIYYNTRENPPSFALMAWHLKGSRRDIAKRIYRHCIAEHGHHELALADLRALGVDTSGIPDGRPLPTTEALIAFAVYQVQNRNPLAYLGYVYHLEMLPATLGHALAGQFAAIGVPKNAMSFLAEHAQADEGHAKWLEGYIRDAAEDGDDMAAVIHGAVGTCKLHGVMLQGILDSVEATQDWKAGGGGAKTAVPAPAWRGPEAAA